MRKIDFTDIDMYPKKYSFNSASRDLSIKSLMIENISRQQEVLAAKKTQLILGDVIEVNFKFGHNTAPHETNENWIDVQVKAQYKVIKIIPHSLTNEIELVVKLYFN